MITLDSNPENDPTRPRNPLKPGELSELEKQLLEEAGVQFELGSPDTGEDPAISDRRALIVEYASQMIEDFGGKAHARKNEIEHWLNRRGYPFDLDTVRLAWADESGGYGLCLPFVRYKNDRYYDLKMVLATDEEKASWQEELKGLRESVIVKIIVPRPGIHQQK